MIWGISHNVRSGTLCTLSESMESGPCGWVRQWSSALLKYLCSAIDLYLCAMSMCSCRKFSPTKIFLMDAKSLTSPTFLFPVKVSGCTGQVYTCILQPTTKLLLSLIKVEKMNMKMYCLCCFFSSCTTQKLEGVNGCSQDFGKGGFIPLKTVLVTFGDVMRVTAYHYICRKQETTTYNPEGKRPYITKIHTKILCMHKTVYTRPFPPPLN